MMNNNGFDQWASSYDQTVDTSDKNNTYPFAGYNKVLNSIYQEITLRKKASVLDSGFGTGTLITQLYNQGYEVYGQDFSQEMLNIAQSKMPNVHLYKGDFTLGLVEKLQNHRYDFIIATYSLHHLTDYKKVSLLNDLYGLLKDGGKILFGDVAFHTKEELEKCKNECKDDLDDEEYYFVYEEISKLLPFKSLFEKVSCCAGIIRINKTNVI